MKGYGSKPGGKVPKMSRGPKGKITYPTGKDNGNLHGFSPSASDATPKANTKAGLKK